MYLFIHAAEREKTYIILYDERTVIAQVRPKFPQGKNADLLKHVHALLKKKNVLPAQLTGIVVLSGPGQFSFLRSGIIIANTFAWALNIPVVGVYGDVLSEEEFLTRGFLSLRGTTRRGNSVVPLYGKEPNITKANKKV